MNLELGGGESPREGYVNMDAYPRPKVDIIHDATKPFPIKSYSVDNIYSCEFIEHIEHKDLPKVLSESFRVLKSGGRFEMGCPDFDGIISNAGSNNEKEVAYMKRGLFGDGSMEFDFHRNIIWFDYIKNKLEKVGFKDVKRLPADGKEYEHLLKDFTPEFIQSVKLCVEAYKP